jgi:hypothetical protein
MEYNRIYMPTYNDIRAYNVIYGHIIGISRE